MMAIKKVKKKGYTDPSGKFYPTENSSWRPTDKNPDDNVVFKKDDRGNVAQVKQGSKVYDSKQWETEQLLKRERATAASKGISDIGQDTGLMAQGEQRIDFSVDEEIKMLDASIAGARQAGDIERAAQLEAKRNEMLMLPVGETQAPEIKNSIQATKDWQTANTPEAIRARINEQLIEQGHNPVSDEQADFIRFGRKLFANFWTMITPKAIPQLESLFSKSGTAFAEFKGRAEVVPQEIKNAQTAEELDAIYITIKGMQDNVDIIAEASKGKSAGDIYYWKNEGRFQDEARDLFQQQINGWVIDIESKKNQLRLGGV